MLNFKELKLDKNAFDNVSQTSLRPLTFTSKGRGARRCNMNIPITTSCPDHVRLERIVGIVDGDKFHKYVYLIPTFPTVALEIAATLDQGQLKNIFVDLTNIGNYFR
ncbi:hypothetical protein F8M41_025041 [Gigaspora margarita]|uniref:Uncharacterized protein n=1 Tax=Gigaspora margarita TaxID=4874 RepID=A0A8H3XKZ2_GIGMA|nr:hypothetical protein F8M41_025041 [Gigaspora margarita]